MRERSQCLPAGDLLPHSPPSCPRKEKGLCTFGPHLSATPHTAVEWGKRTGRMQKRRKKGKVKEWRMREKEQSRTIITDGYVLTRVLSMEFH